MLLRRCFVCGSEFLRIASLATADSGDRFAADPARGGSGLFALRAVHGTWCRSMRAGKPLRNLRRSPRIKDASSSKLITSPSWSVTISRLSELGLPNARKKRGGGSCGKRSAGQQMRERSSIAVSGKMRCGIQCLSVFPCPAQHQRRSGSNAPETGTLREPVGR